MQLSTPKPLPLFRSVNTLAVLARYAAKKGVGLSRLIKNGGIRVKDLDDPDFLVTPDQELIVIKNIINLIQKPGLGLSIGKQYHAGVLGKVGAAAIHSNTFLEALQVLFKYDELLLTYFHFNITVKGNLVHFVAKEKIDLEEAALFIFEREFSSMHRVTTDLMGSPIPFKEIRFAYPRPVHASMYHDLFQCPVIFGTKRHTAIFDKKVLSHQLPMADPLSKKTYVKDCRDRKSVV